MSQKPLLKFLLLCVGLLAKPVLAQEQPTTECVVAPPLISPELESLVTQPPPDVAARDQVLEDISKAWEIDQPVELLARHAEVSMDGTFDLQGQVEVRQGDRRLTADQASYDRTSGDFQASGDVGYFQSGLEITGETAKFESKEGTGILSKTVFDLPGRGRGSAGETKLMDENTLSLKDVRYTACPKGQIDWELVAPDIRINNNKGVGVGRNVRVMFKGFPLLYIPYISFPISDQRKSGVLPPDLGLSNRAGFNIRMPYYWNIRPNMDATITPRWLFDRGIQLNTEYRYLTNSSNGQLDVEFLPNDDETGRDRGFVSWEQTTEFSQNWLAKFEVNDVSDTAYFEDLGDSQSVVSRTHLQRQIELLFTQPNWLFRTRFQNMQTVLDTISASDRPYRRVPQFEFFGAWDGPSRFQFDMDAEIVNFDRGDGVTGWRMDVQPEVSFPLVGPGYYFTPRLAWRHTRYQLSDLEPAEDDSLSRTAPILTLDTGVTLERAIGSRKHLVHTLEPRLYYTYIPFRDQSGLPVFDTASADFNSIQLFRANRFIGADRLGDSNQISFGMSTRVIHSLTGREIISATLGQAIRLNSPNVALPGEAADDQRATELIAEVGVGLSRSWNADVALQWDPNDGTTSKAVARVQYRPNPSSVLNLGYRFRDDELEQSDISFAWPIKNSWRLVGRWNFSIRDSQTLDRLIGVEYERCCWGLRLVSRRFITTRTGESDTSLLLQLELKGLTSVGQRADSFLENGILGYRPQN
ncbi:MAG: LPS assembly protein LptD [Pseudomonadota bacterium]